MRGRPWPLWFPLLSLAVSFAVGVWALPHQPERVPGHWGADGQADRWGSSAEGLFATPVMLLLVSLLILAASRAQPGSAHPIRVVVFGLGLLALLSTTAQAFGGDSFRATMVALSLLFLPSHPPAFRSERNSPCWPKFQPSLG